MWGIRTIGLGCVIMGVIAILGGSGCSSCPCMQNQQQDPTNQTIGTPSNMGNQPNSIPQQRIQGGIN
jgi:hypothetical protein